MRLSSVKIFTVKAFREFAESQPGRRRYDPLSMTECPGAQFIMSKETRKGRVSPSVIFGTSAGMATYGNRWVDYSLKGSIFPHFDQKAGDFWGAIKSTPHTWASLAKRMQGVEERWEAKK